MVFSKDARGTTEPTAEETRAAARADADAAKSDTASAKADAKAADAKAKEDAKPTDPKAYAEAAALIAKDPLFMDRENARQSAADPAKRNFEAMLYADKVANETATEREKALAGKYTDLARAVESDKLAPELEAAAIRNKLIDGYTSESGAPAERAAKASVKVNEETDKADKK